jgi:hypothetical protein
MSNEIAQPTEHELVRSAAVKAKTNSLSRVQQPLPRTFHHTLQPQAPGPLHSTLVSIY